MSSDQLSTTLTSTQGESAPTQFSSTESSQTRTLPVSQNFTQLDDGRMRKSRKRIVVNPTMTTESNDNVPTQRHHYRNYKHQINKGTTDNGKRYYPHQSPPPLDHEPQPRWGRRPLVDGMHSSWTIGGTKEIMNVSWNNEPTPVRRLSRPEHASHPELYGPGVTPHPDLTLPRDMAVFRPEVDDPRHARAMVFHKRAYPNHPISKAAFPDGELSWPYPRRMIHEVTPWFLQRPTRPYAYPPPSADGAASGAVAAKYDPSSTSSLSSSSSVSSASATTGMTRVDWDAVMNGAANQAAAETFTSMYAEQFADPKQRALLAATSPSSSSNGLLSPSSSNPSSSSSSTVVLSTSIDLSKKIGQKSTKLVSKVGSRHEDTNPGGKFEYKSSIKFVPIVKIGAATAARGGIELPIHSARGMGFDSTTTTTSSSSSSKAQLQSHEDGGLEIHQQHQQQRAQTAGGVVMNRNSMIRPQTQSALNVSSLFNSSSASSEPQTSSLSSDLAASTFEPKTLTVNLSDTQQSLSSLPVEEEESLAPIVLPKRFTSSLHGLIPISTPSSSSASQRIRPSMLTPASSTSVSAAATKTLSPFSSPTKPAFASSSSTPSASAKSVSIDLSASHKPSTSFNFTLTSNPSVQTSITSHHHQPSNSSVQLSPIKPSTSSSVPHPSASPSAAAPSAPLSDFQLGTLPSNSLRNIQQQLGIAKRTHVRPIATHEAASVTSVFSPVCHDLSSNGSSSDSFISPIFAPTGGAGRVPATTTKRVDRYQALQKTLEINSVKSLPK